ncbi:ABC transporter substrate-binding protein [Streptomyces mangrovisoli]|uniref:ABC transporter substrate-binding protein n=1 Tax=Streptomyces mangrovisoli TaxID=1428628 RepID=A0A1J4NSL2_9ACTN|nr:ABC transporter substrate-binding protein [Streptomyces mangrovisoli]OIJ65407.1 ABC transporter substrate-binding protein [Streptomyces mangrovisoli]
MVRNRVLTAVAGCCAALLLAACESESTAGSDGSAASGSPVAGGTLRAVEISEPRNLDPALLQNTLQGTALLGNALYGNLMVSDEKTGALQYRMATDFSTKDGGKTFTLKLKDGLKFSDGTALDAAAVKYNWDRLKDPKLGSDSQPYASVVKSTKVVDATTLEVTLTMATPLYGEQVVLSAMNWIASPAALKKGESSFDAHPVGAGPFTLKSWTRGGALDLVKNTSYYDAPKPYLDGITLTTSTDPQQRVNSLTSGGADLGVETDWEAVAKAKAAGLTVETVPSGGGRFLTLNTLRAPFKDVKARQAVSEAIDTDALNAAVYEGKAETASGLFPKASPYYNDVALHTYNKQAAQKLFDELAADGKPVSFTFTAFPTDKALAEAVQAQLSAYDNVTVKIQTVDWSESGKVFGQKQYDMLLSTAFFLDPEPALSSAFSGKSPRNATGIADPQLDAALAKGSSATTDEERAAAYRTVSERLAALDPAILVARTAQATVTKKVGGVVLDGSGSPLPADLWLAK